jgi:F-type H+-transporting ATPase subunit b
MQIISNLALLSLNETLIFQLISFLIFLFIMNRVMFRPLRTIMAERDDHIKKVRLDIVDTGKQFENLVNQIKEQESAVKNEAYDISRKLEEAGNKEADEVINAAKKEISTLKKKVAKELDVQILEARKHLKAESEILATKIMEKVLNRRLTT